jgi:hypothetical protein
MKYATLLLGAVFLFAMSSLAQENSPNSLFVAPSDSGMAGDVSSFVPSKPLLLASAAAPPAAELPASPALLSDSSSEPAQRSGVYRVFETYDWEFYVGYAFFRFHALPNNTESMNGIDLGIAYFPTSSWFGVDGDIFGEFGSFLNHSSRFSDYLGGARVRRVGPRGLNLWAHGLVGYSKFLPQTPFGGQTAFSYEAGGGVDLAVPHRRLAYRIEADMVGTKFFHSNQLSPKISFGVVFKF